MTMLPLTEAPRHMLAGVEAVLTDIDDTLTLHGRLPAEAYDALWKLKRAGIKVVPITGRPAGWCDLIARQWPVDGVVGENGAFYFRYRDDEKRMIRVYAQPAEERRANASRLWRIAERVLQDFPGTAIASDQAYREIDVAIDFCEDVPPLPLATAQKIAEAFHAEGAAAKVSSIHVNAWFGAHDKLTMSSRFLAEAFGINIENDLHKIAYCGDSPNDAPMYAVFPMGIGVANIRPYAKLMPHLPRYVTAGEGGHGFAEFAEAVLHARAQRA
ncbi:HAD-IIB family hydrolase [Aestuariivirga sp.]|jgi:HAD superfamily hydrolase (TIGR01484 family)|uniref:HAD-IIB family hydrolase n=1 Tax=Aestuariivirga sp. TaxID=2650926 RepID=UPI0037846144